MTYEQVKAVRAYAVEIKHNHENPLALAVFTKIMNEVRQCIGEERYHPQVLDVIARATTLNIIDSFLSVPTLRDIKRYNAVDTQDCAQQTD